ncbi:MAG TPA: hypothetical protein VFK29_08965, partial [Rhodanobacteraceae bacterium]|nr:hypothetical protein [Rhodanobacteraceae bacterium]
GAAGPEGPQGRMPGVFRRMHTTCRLRLRLEPAYSYSAATRLRRGTDVDQPRNLAKSVTVE